MYGHHVSNDIQPISTLTSRTATSSSGTYSPQLPFSTLGTYILRTLGVSSVGWTVIASAITKKGPGLAPVSTRTQRAAVRIWRSLRIEPPQKSLSFSSSWPRSIVTWWRGVVRSQLSIDSPLIIAAAEGMSSLARAAKFGNGVFGFCISVVIEFELKNRVTFSKNCCLSFWINIVKVEIRWSLLFFHNEFINFVKLNFYTHQYW